VPLLPHLRVVDGYQRNGVGRRLIETAEAFLKACGHRVPALGVDPGDEPVISFYRSLSFRAWREQTLTTFREEVRDDGTTVRVEDRCLVFVKDIGRP
jgi:GNAT superfamily N-acetyltransferase